MKTYNIIENGHQFAKIQARNPRAALRKAANEYPRRACDYGGEPCVVEWRAWPEDGDADCALARVPVPSRGCGRVNVFG